MEDKKKLLFCIVGRTGAGKSVVAKEVSKRLGLVQVRSYTTREPRPKEIEMGLEKTDHIFVSDEEFDRLDPVAFVQIGDARYCTTREILRESDIYVIDPFGIRDLKEHAGDEFRIVEVLISANRSKRRWRFLRRGETAGHFEEREKAENLEFSQYEAGQEPDFVIRNNGKLPKAVDVLEQYIVDIRKECREGNADGSRAGNIPEQADIPAGNVPYLRAEKQNK